MCNEILIATIMHQMKGCHVLQNVYERQVAQLKDLIDIINGDLSKNDRKKLITLCTIDVHARDVVQRLIDERVESSSAFQWQSQLRYTQHDKTKECQVHNITQCRILFVKSNDSFPNNNLESCVCCFVENTCMTHSALCR